MIAISLSNNIVLQRIKAKLAQSEIKHSNFMFEIFIKTLRALADELKGHGNEINLLFVYGSSMPKKFTFAVACHYIFEVCRFHY